MERNIRWFDHAARASAIAAVLACASPSASAAPVIRAAVPSDVLSAVTALPRAEILDTTADGLPTVLQGDIGRVGALPLDPSLADAVLRSRLRPALAALRLDPASLDLRSLREDAQGNRHARYEQVFDGLEVVGGDLVVHVDTKGTIYGVNGTARGDLPPLASVADIGERSAARTVTTDPRYAGMSTTLPRKVYLLDERGTASVAYEFIASGERGADPVSDKVYVDTTSGAIIAVHPQIHFGLKRRVYTANNGSSLPGTVVRTEGQVGRFDTDVNAAYTNSGLFWNAFDTVFERDSYNDAGAVLHSTVHYRVNYCNAFWNGTQVVFGDGNPATACLPLARATDVVAHELSHAITEKESKLVYSGESGGLNEAMSDAFGVFVEAWNDGGRTGALPVSADTWQIGEDVMTPALRFMNDPAADGVSSDFYTSDVGTRDVHYSSGVGNLAFYLLAQGGSHPRGKSSTVVTGIGLEKAVRIFYKANVDYLTSNATFSAARTATIAAAGNLGYDLGTQIAVSQAWDAVGVVGTTPGTPAPGGTVLVNNTPVTGLSGAQGSSKYYQLVVPANAGPVKITLSTSSGDADLYVRKGATPTLTQWDCRPYMGGGSTETCTINNAAGSTLYLMVYGYQAYSGGTLTASYGTTTEDDVTPLVNGQGVLVSGAASSVKYFKITTPAGRKLTVKVSGGSGDVDLYLRQGAKPTTTTYACRPYLNGVDETCTVNSTVAATYYVMLRGYSAYSGVTLRASYP